MSFDSLGDFLAMGGHGLYVWLAYGAAVVVVVANVVAVRRARQRCFREARALARRTGAGQSGTSAADGNQTPLEP